MADVMSRTNMFEKLPSFSGKDYKWYGLHFTRPDTDADTYESYVARHDTLTNYTKALVAEHNLYMMEDGVMAIDGETLTLLTLQLLQGYHFVECN